MKNGGRTAGRKVTAVLLLLAMSFIIGNKVFFIHTHLDSHGNIVIHSHPYNKSGDNLPVKTHHHSDAVLAFIATTDQNAIQASYPAVLSPNLPEAIIRFTCFSSYTLPDFSIIPVRGPPVI